MYSLFSGPRGLFKGLSIALVNVPLFLGIYWYSYENMKKLLNTHYDLPLPLLHIASATSSAFVADCVSNPLWVVRTRLQTEYLHSTLSVHPSGTPTQPVSAFTMVRTIYTQEGVRAFYKGLTASFLGLPHVAIQFPLYEHFKAKAKERRLQSDPSNINTSAGLSPVDIIASSIMAKVIAISITYPHEVIRIRMQDSRITCIPGQVTAANHPLSIREVVTGILKHEGYAALFSGFQVNLVRVIPATVSTFLTYEYVHNFLKERES
jgi:solute carrier family 25 (mitochondrial folate transporter), member 32